MEFCFLLSLIDIEKVSSKSHYIFVLIETQKWLFGYKYCQLSQRGGRDVSNESTNVFLGITSSSLGSNLKNVKATLLCRSP